MTDIGLQWEVTRGMQVGIDIGSESDGYRLRVGGYSGMHIGTDIANRVTAVVYQLEVTWGMQVGIDNKSDGYHLTVGEYSRDAGRYLYW